MKRAALALALCTLSSGARAYHPPSSPVLARLAPDRDALHEAQVVAREQRLVRAIAALPDVAQVTVQLTIPDDSRSPLDRPAPPVGASLVIALRGPGPADATLFSIVQAALPGLTPAHFAVSRHPLAQPTPAPAEASGDRTALRFALAASLACNALLSAFLVFRTRARRIGARPRAR